MSKGCLSNDVISTDGCETLDVRTEYSRAFGQIERQQREVAMQKRLGWILVSLCLIVSAAMYYMGTTQPNLSELIETRAFLLPLPLAFILTMILVRQR